MSDADGADFPPETNPDYKAIHEADFGPPFVDADEANLHPFQDADEFGHGLGEVDGLGDEAPEPEEPNGADTLRELAVSLREAADAVEAMADRDVEEQLPAELSTNADITFYTYSKDEFRAFARRIGYAKKSGFSDAFWLERKFGKGDSSVKMVVHAPNREAVCEKRVIGYETVEETKTYTEKTGRTVQEPQYEWDCGSVLAGTEVEQDDAS